MRKRLVASVCVLVMVMLASGPVSAEKKPGDQLPLMAPECGETLTKSFRLSADRVCDDGDGWYVGKDGLTIDLNGKVLLGGSEDIGISSPEGHTGTLVRNGAVRAFQYGLRLGAKSTIANVVVVDHEYGIEGAEDLLVTRSSIVANTTGYRGGLRSGEQLVGNRFTANDNAIVLDRAIISFGPTAVTMRKNVIAGNFERGIWIADGSGHVIEENRVVGNGHTGGANGFAGIQIDPDASAVKTTANAIDGNGNDGYRDDGANNIVKNNKARGNGLYDPDGDGTGIETGSGATGSGNLSVGNDSATACTAASMCKSSVGTLDLPFGQPACGTTVEKSFKLEGNVTCADDEWITVIGKDVTIDLNGKTVSGPGQFDSLHPAIVTTSSRTTIRNGAIRGFTEGVVTAGLGKVSGARLSDVVLADNSVGARLAQRSGDQGVIADVVAVRNTQGLEIRNAQRVQDVVMAANRFQGIVTNGPFPAAQIRIADSLIAGNGTMGLSIGGSPIVAKGNLVMGNGQTRDGHSPGFYVFGEEPLEISNNVIEGNGSHGVQDNDVHDTLIKGNRARANGFSQGIADLVGLGIDASTNTAVQGSGNPAVGNDDRAECAPAFLCPGATAVD